MSELPKLPPQLPNPVNSGDFFTLALVYEIRGLRADLAAAATERASERAKAIARQEVAGAYRTSGNPSTVDLKEPASQPGAGLRHLHRAMSGADDPTQPFVPEAFSQEVTQAAAKPQLVDLTNPTGGATVRVPMPNLPPLSDEAGKAMARALDDGRPKRKPKAGT